MNVAEKRDKANSKLVKRNNFSNQNDTRVNNQELAPTITKQVDSTQQPSQEDNVQYASLGFNNIFSNAESALSTLGNAMLSLVYSNPNDKPIIEEDYTESEIKPLQFEDMIAKNISKVNANNIIRKNAEETLNSLSKEEVISLQKRIANAGYYDSTLKGNRKSVKRVQRMLIDKGYLDNAKDKNGNYKEADGFVGDKTQTAYNNYLRDKNIDGVVGRKTKEGYINLISGSNWDRAVSTKNVDGCAQWVTKKYEDAVGLVSTQNGVIGDAWTMLKNIENKGGTMLYNIYDSSFNNIKDTKLLKAKTEAAIADNPLDYSMLQVGDVVGIYMPSSNMHQTALKNGTTKNTHVGIVTGFDDDGMPIIEHNIHQIHKRNRADKLTGSLFGKPKITVVARPKNSGSNVPEIPIIERPSRYKVDEKFTNNSLTSFMNSMEGAADIVHKLYPDVNIDDAMMVAIAPLKRETNFMTNQVSQQGIIANAKEAIGNFARKNIFGRTEYTKSSNLSKLKLNSLTDSERKITGIKTAKDLEDPVKAGFASLLLAARRIDYFQKLQKQYNQIGLTNDDIINASILAYNQGIGKLRTIGFNDKGVAPEELESLRNLSNPETRIKDISSTKYKYFGKLGQFIYDNFEDPYIPYVAAARDAFSKYVTKSNNRKRKSLGGRKRKSLETI